MPLFVVVATETRNDAPGCLRINFFKKDD